MPRLALHVHVHDADGVAHVFGPDDDVPAWAVERLTNPKVWAVDDEPDVAPADAQIGDPGETVNPLLTADPAEVAAWVTDATIEDITSALDELPAEAQAPVAEFLAAVEADRDKPRKTLLDALHAVIGH